MSGMVLHILNCELVAFDMGIVGQNREDHRLSFACTHVSDKFARFKIWRETHSADMSPCSILKSLPHRIYGLLSGTIVWILATLITFPFSGLTIFIFPFFMWFTLRWLEDCLSSLRAAIALLSMLAIGKTRLKEIRNQREELRERVVKVAVERAELPEDPDVFVKLAKERRSKDKGGKVGRLGYFSLRRRRKKDYNEVGSYVRLETLRNALTVDLSQIMYLWDQSEYAM